MIIIIIIIIIVITVIIALCICMQNRCLHAFVQDSKTHNLFVEK